jgi:hypothetical protein
MFTEHQKAQLLELADLMKQVVADHSKGYDVFKWVWNEGQELLHSCWPEGNVPPKECTLVDRILSDISSHAIDWVVGEFDGRSFRDTLFNYNTIEQIVNQTLQQDDYEGLLRVFEHERLYNELITDALRYSVGGVK